MDLTDAQRALLAPAAARNDRCLYPVVAPLKGGAVGNICRSLLRRGLIEEVPAGDAHSVWRCGDEGAPLTLRISDAGVAAMADATELGPDPENDTGVQPARAERAEQDGQHDHRGLVQNRPGGKQQALLALLRKSEGTTIAEMRAATGWQPHSVRGALSGIISKKLGHTVTSTNDTDRGRIYRIAD
jgi:hypothetical protein